MSRLAWDNIKETASPLYFAYREAIKQPREAQEALLRSILLENQSSEFGVRNKFSQIRSIRDFQQRVEICDYEKISPDIVRMTEGRDNVLTSESVLWFEKTSGASSSSKLIPVTTNTLTSFRQALFPWLYDLCENYPAIMEGKAFWSVNPVGQRPSETSGGIPIGSSNDAIYFGESIGQHIQSTFAVPAWVSHIEDIEVWQYVTLRYLLSEENLRLISIWSPTFLLRLLKVIPGYLELLIEDIETGGLSCPGIENFRKYVRFQPDSNRAKLIRRAIRPEQIDTALLWPDLILISCWASAQSARYIGELKQLFPNVMVQPKGLLATEGAYTIPLSGVKFPVLTMAGGFYEFLANDGQVYLADEVELGETYSILLTNKSGLYRYRVGDRVRAVGWHQSTPCLEFIGRERCSDLCGEKLSEDFIHSILKQIPGFSLMVPVTDESNFQSKKDHSDPYYRIYVDEAHVSPSRIEALARSVEAELLCNPQYEYARRLGQLGPVAVVACTNPLQTYQDHSASTSYLGVAISPPSLSDDQAWHRRFEKANIKKELTL